MKKNKNANGWVSRLIRFFLHDIYSISENELGRWMRLLVRLVKKIILSARGFVDNRVNMKASALTYYTMLSIVPILALFLAIGRGFGIQTNIEEWIITIMGDNSEVTPIILGFVHNYLEQAHGGVFVGVGIVLLFWAVVSMFRQIELAFNMIWNVKKNRSIVRQFTTYLTILIVVPLLVVISSGLNVKIDSYVEQIANSSAGDFLIPIYQFLIKLAPFVLYWLLFTILLLIIPNTKVQIKDALLSGVVTGTAFLCLQYLYLSGQISLSRYNAVYGSFAALPLLLFWLQLSWLVVLYGAVLCYVSQNLMNYDFEKDSKQISRRYKDYLLLVILRVIINRFASNDPPPSANDISTKYNIPIVIVIEHLKTLTETHLISEIYTEQYAERGYQPALDINAITLRLVSERLESYGFEGFNLKNSDEFGEIWNNINKIKDEISKKTSDILIKNL